jgi:hypothetical protein
VWTELHAIFDPAAPWTHFYGALYFWVCFGLAFEKFLFAWCTLYMAHMLVRAGLAPHIRYKVIKFSAVPLARPVAFFMLSCGVGYLLEGCVAAYVPLWRAYTWWHASSFIVGLWAVSHWVRVGAGQFLVLKDQAQAGSGS